MRQNNIDGTMYWELQELLQQWRNNGRMLACKDCKNSRKAIYGPIEQQESLIDMLKKQP